MLASNVERMVFIRLNRHLIGEVRELDAAVAQARVRIAKSAKISVAAPCKAQGRRVYLNLCVPIRVFMFLDGSNIWSTVLYTHGTSSGTAVSCRAEAYRYT